MADFVRGQLPAVVWVLLIWLLLWGEFTVANVVGGLAVGVVVVALAPQPRRASDYRPSVVGLVRFGLYFIKELASATHHTARVALRPRRCRPAVVLVELQTANSMVATLVANCVTLTPGTISLEIDLPSKRLWVHVLDAADESAEQAAIDSVRGFERRALAALRPRAHEPEGGGNR